MKLTRHLVRALLKRKNAEIDFHKKEAEFWRARAKKNSNKGVRIHAR